MNNLDVTLIIAISALVISFSHLIIDYYVFRRDNPKIEVKVNPGVLTEHKKVTKVLTISAINKGRRYVILSSLGINSTKLKGVWWIMNAISGLDLPKRLDGGDSHSVLLDYEEVKQMNEGNKLGKAFFVDKTGEHYYSKENIFDILQQ